MAIIKWEPFGELDRFFDEVRYPLFPTGRMDFAVDLYEEGNDIVAEMNLPGVDPEKVQVSVEGEYLRVASERSEEKETKRKNYYSKEIRRGAFERVVRLPEAVDREAVRAEYENGVLKVVMPKKEQTASEKVIVEVKKK